jgi:hypothetical protein
MATHHAALFVLTPVLALHWPTCAPQIRPTLPTGRVAIEALWQPPVDLASRDVFNGPWGADLAPRPDAGYTFVKPKLTGVNPGMTVRDPLGREWSVKQSKRDGRAGEGPIEVVVSRILSAVGYHQPPVYFLREFMLVDAFGERLEPGGRFRLDHEWLEETDQWSWQQNPFVGTRPYQGLLVILLMLNSSDLKNSNNSTYAYRPEGGAGQTWYVVRDLGTALGTTGRFRPVRGDVERFEDLPFVTGVSGGFVEFDYRGFHKELFRQRITPADVAWACDLLDGLSARQWQDAFRAGGFDAAAATRYIARLRAKIAEGRALSSIGGQ